MLNVLFIICYDDPLFKEISKLLSIVVVINYIDNVFMGEISLYIFKEIT